MEYDPYSLTADEDYEKLKQEINELDILTVLSQELNKSRIHTALMKKIISSLRYSDNESLNNAIQVISSNIELLAPVFPNVMILFESIFDKLSRQYQIVLLNTIYELVKSSSYILKIDLNIAYAIRVISKIYSEDNEIVLMKLLKNTDSPLIRRDIIIIMAKWNATHWISNLKNRYSSLTTWEKRAFILASYKLGDEGSHWRSNFKEQFDEIDLFYRDWIAKKIQSPSWELPI